MFAVAHRWKYQTRRLWQLENTGTELSDGGLHSQQQGVRPLESRGPHPDNFMQAQVTTERGAL
jgi:hypothetical protein